MVREKSEFYKFKEKYSVKSTRLSHFDYSQNGYYFVTICTKAREYFFGEICNNVMVLNELGNIAEKFWLEIPNHFPNAKLDEFVIMPNHVHGIVVIENDVNNIVETCHGMSLRKYQPQQKINQFSKPIKKSLSMIINHYKGSVKRYFNKNDIFFAWQSRFYDHIIRNEKSLQNIREYIVNNPLKWDLDENNLQNRK